MCQALLEIMELEINQIVRQETEKEIRAKEKERKEKEKAVRQLREEAEEFAIRMIKMQKFTVEEIHECIPKLSLDEIKRLVKSQEQV